MKLPYHDAIQVYSDLNLLPQVLAWFDQFKQTPIPPDVWLECQLALAEGFTNAVRHAHAGKSPDTPILIEACIDGSTITLKVWDNGPGFDFDRLLQHTQLVEPSAERGRGLRIMQRIADVFSYVRVEQRNCLTLVRTYRAMPLD